MCCGCCKSCGCPQWPDKCCLCCAPRVGAAFTGLASVLGNLAVLLPCVYALVKQDFWNEVFRIVQDWVVGNHWDSEVTSFTLRLLSQANEHHALLLIAIIAFCAVHIFNALLLVLGSLLRKRLLLLPWLVQDMLVIVLAAVVFVLWSFLSFFLHVLLAVCFPAVAGLLLGFWIYAWKNVRDLFHRLGSDAGPNHQGTIYRKLPASVGTSGGQGTRSLLGP